MHKCHLTIRKRGYIKNDTKFYLINDLADDDDLMLEMLDKYEGGKT